MDLKEALRYACVWACEFSRLSTYAETTDNFRGYMRLLQTLWNAFLGSLEQQNLDGRTMPLAEMAQRFRKFLCGRLHNQQLNPETFSGDDELENLIQDGNRKGAKVPCETNCLVPKEVAQQTLETFVDFCANQARISPHGLHEVPPPFVFAMALVPGAFVFKRRFDQTLNELTITSRMKTQEREQLIIFFGLHIGTQLLWPGDAGDSSMLQGACENSDPKTVRIGEILRDILQVGAQREGRGRGRRRRIAQRDVATIVELVELREGWREHVLNWMRTRKRTEEEKGKEEKGKKEKKGEGEEKEKEKEERAMGPQITSHDRDWEEDTPSRQASIASRSDVEEIAEARRLASHLLPRLDRCIEQLKKIKEGCPSLNELVQCLHPEEEQPQEQGSASTDLWKGLAALAQNEEVFEKLKEIDCLIRKRCRCEQMPWPKPKDLEGRYLMELLREAECLLRRYERAPRGRVDRRLREAVGMARERFRRRPSRNEIAQEIRHDPCLWVRIVIRIIVEEEKEKQKQKQKQKRSAS